MTAIRSMKPDVGTSISWEEHYQEFVNPALFTQLLREAVPVLAHVNWSVLETQEGFARTLLPLTYESTNQHGTHQAALIALAADYTGGIALATLIRGTPIAGVHPQAADKGAALWLASIDITYKMPSVADLTVTAVIPPEEFEPIRRKYREGDPNVVIVGVLLESDGEQVAYAKLGYYLRQCRALKPNTLREPLSTPFRHRVKASARLIAGLRATENHVPNPLYTDPYSELAAGVHGHLLAQRFSIILPALRDMVAARTRHIDDLLTDCLDKGMNQIVFVGVGFDFRQFRVPNCRRAVRVFELDLPYMLDERSKIISKMGGVPAFERKPLAINLEFEDVGTILLAGGFEPSLTSLFIFEGTSMYFDDESNARILSSIHRVMRNSNSRIWIDVVAQSVIAGTTGYLETEAFLRGMEKLGEPFRFGLDDPSPFFAALGYQEVSSTTSDIYDKGSTDPTFGLYRFCVLRPCSEDGASGQRLGKAP
jgi:methyltransferase (TIGR00027 family)